MENGTVTDPRVLVTHVVRNSPAGRGGIRENDRILRVDGAIVGMASEVVRLVAMRGAGDVVMVTIARGDKETELKIPLAERPNGEELMRMDHVGAFAPAWAGALPVGSAPKSIESLRGRVVVIDFWASWCGPCRLVAPRLNALHARYGAQGLSIVGITADDAEDAAAFAGRTSIRYPVVVDVKGETSRAYTVSSLPTLFIVDKRGVVRDVEIGFDPSPGRDAQREQLIRTLLAEPAPAAESK
jgi:thiol-disulfide isomerase/thioredoxin